ncbi:MAG: KpsF/GutQ family sugar-phosphate isomerase [Thermodesulfobacteriota bacterium]
MKTIIKQAKEVLKIEAEGLLALIDRVGDEFARAVDVIYQAKGRVIVTGLGKSGLVGRKIVATLNSTGTPALFLHPVEAVHGDLGMVCPDDVVLALSNSGETQEIVAIIASVRRIGPTIIVMTGDLNSTLAGRADVVLDVAVPREACPMGLAPTASTTAALALGDALAVALIKRRKFNSNDFKRLHPGGTLGERLAVQVMEVMITGRRVPTVREDTPLAEAVAVMNKSSLGVVLVVGPHKTLAGLFTDGDLRRAVAATGRLPQVAIGRVMTRDPKRITKERLAAEALEIMQAHEITVLPIVDASDRLLGMIHLHDLLGKGKFSFSQG